MSELRWIKVTSKSVAYCAQVLQELEKVQEKFEKLQQEAARLKALVEKQEKLIQEQHGGYDTVH